VERERERGRRGKNRGEESRVRHWLHQLIFFSQQKGGGERGRGEEKRGEVRKKSDREAEEIG